MCLTAMITWGQSLRTWTTRYSRCVVKATVVKVIVSGGNEEEEDDDVMSGDDVLLTRKKMCLVEMTIWGQNSRTWTTRCSRCVVKVTVVKVL